MTACILCSIASSRLVTRRVRAHGYRYVCRPNRPANRVAVSRGRTDQ